MKKPTDLLNDPVIKYTAIGVGLIVVGKAFGIVDRILQWTGLQDSEHTQALDQTATNPGSWWSPSFWRLGPNGTYILTSAAVTKYVDDIRSAIGYFDDDEDAVKNVFRQLKTQSQASYLADAFQQRYGQDLLSWLRGGSWPKDRLSDYDVHEITQFVDRLPKYYP